MKTKPKAASGGSRFEARQRLADRLGFLLAKRLLRTQGERRRANQEDKAQEGKTIDV